MDAFVTSRLAQPLPNITAGWSEFAHADPSNTEARTLMADASKR